MRTTTIDKSATRMIGWSVWTVVAIAWTVGLTRPNFGPEGFGATEQMREFSRFLISKTTHVGVYTAWTILTGWLRPALGVRFFLLIFLMSHAVLTEWAQTYVEGRTGLLRDAALDQLGIFLGVAISYRWWTEIGGFTHNDERTAIRSASNPFDGDR